MVGLRREEEGGEEGGGKEEGGREWFFGTECQCDRR